LVIYLYPNTKQNAHTMNINLENGRILLVNKGLRFSLLDDDKEDNGNYFEVLDINEKDIFVKSDIMGELKKPLRTSQFIEMLNSGEIETI